MKRLDAPIVAVAVYSDRAKITRGGAIALESGRQQATIVDLPMHLDADSLRARVRGESVRMLGIEATTEIFVDTPENSAAELEARLEALERQKRELTDNEEVAGSKLDFFKQLQSTSSELLARGLSKGRIQLEQTDAVADYVARQQATVRARSRELTIERLELSKQLDAVARKLERIRTKKGKQRRIVQVLLDVEQETTVEIEIDYLITTASWTPLYDVRVSGKRVEFSYLARVTQQTGEDWPAVPLLFSTARSFGKTTLPKLDPWYLDVGYQYATALEPLPCSKAKDDGIAAGAGLARKRSSTSIPEAPPAAAPPPPAKIAQAKVVSAGPTVSYQAEQSTNVPSDGEPHQATIAVFDFEAKFEHIIAPSIAEEAVLKATFVNNSPLKLLPATAAVFHGEEFIGRVPVELVMPNEEVKLSLGTDERVKVERELMKRKTTKTLLTDKRRTTFGYKTTIQNLANETIQVLVIDQAPLPRHEKIAVDFPDPVPKPTSKSDLNILEWKFEMKAGEKKTIELSFTIEHPRDLIVSGLPDEDD